MGLKRPLVITAGVVEQLQSGDTIDPACGPLTGLTATRVPYADSATTLTDSANLTFDGTTLTSVAFAGLLHPPAGTTDAGTAPMKFSSGALNTVPEAGAVEFLTDKLYFTITTGAARKELAITEGLTATRIPYATTNGRLTDSANLTFDGTKLTTGGIIDVSLEPSMSCLVMSGTGSRLTTSTSIYVAGNYIHAPGFEGKVRLLAGSTSALTAPLGFTSGDLLSTPEVGMVEFLTDKLYFTITTGAARKELAITEGLTSGRIPFATTDGRLTDSANVQYDGTNIILSGLKYPNTDGSGEQVLATDGANTLGWATLKHDINPLINSGFAFFQRQAPATLTARSDDTYGPDRWNILTQTASIQCSRTAGDTRAVNAVLLTQNQATAQRFGLLQILENQDSKQFRGSDVTFAARVKCSAGQTIRAAVLEWTGTADTVTSDVVKDWTSGTYTVDNFFLTSDLTVTNVGSVLPDAGVWTTITAQGKVSGGCNNLIVFIWVKDTLAQGGTLTVTEVGLYPQGVASLWFARPIQQELALCQRYYEKTWPVDIAPGTSSDGFRSFWKIDGVVTFITGGGQFLTAKRISTPTMVVYSQGGVGGKVSDVLSGTATGLTAIATHISQLAFTLVYANGNNFTDYTAYAVHFTADAEL